MSDTPISTPVGLIEQLKSFNRVFWIGNTMEMLERLAYYGLRTVLPVYMVLSIEEGGPQFDHLDKGWIYFWWAIVQSILPVFTGGFADSMGYKRTVGVSIAIKTVGYLVMAFAIEIAAFVTDGANIGVPAHPATLWTFFVGAMLLAFGTAVFKPGIQAIIAHQLNDENDSVGWSTFYQLVNVGGFLGPFLAGVMKLLAWKWVFIACAIIVCLNYFLMVTFKEPHHPDWDTAKAPDPITVRVLAILKTLWHSGIGICEPRLMSFLVLFSGFWMMFNQLFDLLPNYITDWVDSSMVLAIISPMMTSVPEEWGGNLPQEFMLNINAGMCMLFAFLIGYLTGKVRAMYAMIFGMLLSSVAIFGLGLSVNGWVILGAIAFFSLGELSASPTKMRYFSSIAPPGRKGMYLGYINATGGIGWAIGSIIAGGLYQEKGDKVVLAKRHLIDTLGQSAEAVDALPKTEVMPFLADELGMAQFDAQMLLWNTYHPNELWTYFAIVGLVSMAGLIAFDLITRMKLKYESAVLLILTMAVSGWSYGIGYAVMFGIFIVFYEFVRIVVPNALPRAAQES
ncbi:MAG: MFS transporter [Rhodobacterales bacterium]|nr:MFS transporter [Rhodobacterales bacterium]